MRLLLDTHILLWTIAESRRLSSAARALIGKPDNELTFSSASLVEVVIKAGSRLYAGAPDRVVAIDLPLKILVAQDKDGAVNVCYNAPGNLQQRHGFPQDLLSNIAVVETLASKAAE